MFLVFVGGDVFVFVLWGCVVRVCEFLSLVLCWVRGVGLPLRFLFFQILFCLFALSWGVVLWFCIGCCFGGFPAFLFFPALSSFFLSLFLFVVTLYVLCW